MSRIREHIHNGVFRKGKSEYSPEEEIIMDMFDIAIGDVKSESMEYYQVSDRAESKRWLLSDHAFWIGSSLFGVEAMNVFRNWVRDGMPEPREARKRKVVYETVGRKF